MSFVAVGAAVAVAGVGAGIYGTVSASNQAEKNRRSAAQSAAAGTISYPEFPEEASRLFRGTEQPLLQAALGEQQALLQPFLGGFGGGTQLPQAYGNTPAIALEAGRQAAGGTGGLNQVASAAEGLNPQLLAALSQLVLQRGSQLQGVVPAGYGPFFQPAQRSKQGPPISNAAPPDYTRAGYELGAGLGTIGSQSFIDTASY